MVCKVKKGKDNNIIYVLSKFIFKNVSYICKIK